MKRPSMMLLIVLSVFLFTVVACAGVAENEPGPAIEAKGKAMFSISDPAADMGAVSSIQLTIDSVRVHSQGGAWTTLSTNPQTFDLLELRAKGASQLLAQADLAAGSYDQMELNISRVVVIDDKGQHEAKLPSNKLHLQGELEVQTNATATANFDFLADKSLHLTGEGHYILAPVIQLETRANAIAQIQPNNEMQVSGGAITTEAELGIDVEGNVDAGLRISPDAALTVAASGKIIQTRGQALAIGTVKAVDSASGTVTITTKMGTDLVLHLAGDSAIKVKGSSANAVVLANNIGSEVIVEYDAETKAVAELAAHADRKAKAEVGGTLNLRGTIKSVDTAAGTVTLATDSGADVVLKVDADARLHVDGGLSDLVGLNSRVGSRIEVGYNATGGTIGQLRSQAEAKATVSGMLKAVDAVAGTVVVTTKAGADVTLNLSPESKVLVDGSLAELDALESRVGSEVTAEYSQRTRIIAALQAQGHSEQPATITGSIKAVNPAQGTLTIVTPGGTEVVLDLAVAKSIMVDGSPLTLADLSARVGAQVTAQYNPRTRTATQVSAQSKGEIKGAASGTLKSVDTAAETITVTTESGAEIVLNLTTNTQLWLNGSSATLDTLAVSTGAPVRVEYDAPTQNATSIKAQAQVNSSTSVAGTLKGVNLLASTVTIATEGGTELVLKVKPLSEITVGGSASLLPVLSAQIGAEVRADYHPETMAILTLRVQG